MSALDDHLWTFTDDSFLPHGTDREAARRGPAHPPRRSAPRTPTAPRSASSSKAPICPPISPSYERLVILFDGNDDQALAVARDQWRAVKEGGHEATYWQQDERRAVAAQGVRRACIACEHGIVIASKVAAGCRDFQFPAKPQGSSR